MAGLQCHLLCLWCLISALGFTYSQNNACSLEGEVRLRGGSVSHEGRVELCSDGQWGTVCDDNWDDDDASVVCRQLGFQDTGAVGRRHSAFERGVDLIHDVKFSCMGDEPMLASCQSHRERCGHDDEAGVICRQVACNDGDIQLVDSTLEQGGRVEVCLNQQWTSVCDNDWSYQDAAVVCKQLGYSSLGALPWSVTSTLRPSGLQFVNCSGRENKLIDCPVIPQLYCNTTLTVAVQCSLLTITTIGANATIATTTTLTNDFLMSANIYPWIIAGVIVGVLVGVILLLVTCLLAFYCARLRALGTQQHQCTQHTHCHCTCTSTEEGQNIKLNHNDSYTSQTLSTEDLLEENENPCYEHRLSVCLAEANPCYGYRNPHQTTTQNTDTIYYENPS